MPTVLLGDYTYNNDGSAPVIEVVDGCTYVNGILIVNKTYSVPKDLNPGGLHPDAKTAFENMQAAAAAEGVTLKIISDFRPYAQQYSTYNNYSARDGKEMADRYSARPGHSEHQTGLAMDINSLRTSFANTAAGKWLSAHCAEYGFIIRYGADKEEKTGFMYEPWHIRYLGTELAKAVTESGLCLEEYLGITSAYAE
ncbi:MAG: M15 family metallopeptidase [Clostridia bacterium]|nr:M15 family metallopeptidase [Clostridia bacterium]